MERALVERLEAAVARLESLAAGGSIQSIDAEISVVDPAIKALDELRENSLGKFLAAAEKIGGQVLESSKLVEQAFSVLRNLLVEAKQRKKPDTAELIEFLKPLNEVIMKANALTEGKRSEVFNHVKSAADSLSALAWIAYSGKDCGMSLPTAHVEESWQMAEFYSNKILVNYRNKDANHVEWVRCLKELYMPSLRDFVKAFYPLGPVWGVMGKTAPVPAKPPQTKAPAPPPPPRAPLFSTESAPPPAAPKGGLSAVFQEISSSKSVTAGLRKVTDDMKSKNRTDKSGVVTLNAKETQKSLPAFSKVGPPKLELQMGRKWAVENQIGKKNLFIDECDAKQSVYIFGCKDSVLHIKGKVNNITVDKCTKMGIVFTDVVAACEVVNCIGVEVQCQGSAPTISVDNTSGCQLYLSKEALAASITTAKSSEVNVLVPGLTAEDDWVELALPQQFIHVFKDGQFETSPVSHSGG
ncbi:cyclase associated protein 1 [Wolffia australiana]